MKVENLFANIPTELPAEVFQNLVVSDKLRIKRILSQPDEQTIWIAVFY